MNHVLVLSFHIDSKHGMHNIYTRPEVINMEYDGKLLALAREKLADIKEKNQIKAEQRQAEIYQTIPRILEIDLILRQQMQNLIKLTIEKSQNLEEYVETIKQKSQSLQEEKRSLLVNNGYAPDFLEPIYYCNICRDTGYHEGKICTCLNHLYNIELTNTLSPLLKTGGENFSNFDLTLYSDIPNADGFVPRLYMQNVLNICINYASKFPAGGMNLLFQGGSGLGKTFTSGCIAQSVAERGFSVCYDTCISALEAFDIKKFGRNPEDQLTATEKVERMLSCDLMILDDLGTEITMANSQSSLYTLINTRIINNKNMIISTNLTESDREKRYSKQICSRLVGEFSLIPFIGEDIRKKKNHF